MELLGYFATFTMGIALGLMGGGGSILTVPILVYLFSLSPTLATAYSLFIVGTTSLLGSLVYLRKNEIDFKAGLMIAVPSIVGVQISRGMILPKIPEVIISQGNVFVTKELLVMFTFALIMILASYSMIKKASLKKATTDYSGKKSLKILITGLAIGMIAGFVGAGGGFLIIPALVVFAGLSMRVAVGTSLIIIAAQSIFGFAGDITRGLPITWLLLGLLTFIAGLGIFLGSAVAHKIQEQKLKIGFGWFVLCMGTIIFVEQIIHLL